MVLAVGGATPSAFRAHCVPTNGGCVSVAGGHGWLLAEAFEVPDDVAVLAVDHMLVPERGRRGCVPDAGHQRVEARAARRRQRRRGISQVMKAEAAHADLGSGRFPDALAEVAAPHRQAVNGREHEALIARLGVQIDVHRERPGNERWDADCATPGSSLGRTEEEPAIDLTELAGDPDRVRVEVDVAATERPQVRPIADRCRRR